MIRIGARGGLLALALAGCTAAPTELCSADEINAALDRAVPGDVVEMGECTAEGRLTVPAGVTLRGHGPGSVITSTATAIELAGDGARVEDLRVEHDGGHGIVAVGAGSIAIERVEIHSTLGRSAIGISGSSSAILRDVIVTGPVTAENESEVPVSPTADDTALVGIALVGVPSAELDDVRVSGFGIIGVASSDTNLVWRGGEVVATLAIGVWIEGGRATIEDVTIADTFRGFSPHPTWGLLVKSGAEIETTGVTVRQSRGGFGVGQLGGSAVHSGLVCEENQGGGVLALRTSSFHLTGESEIRNNDYAGVIAVAANGLVIESSTVDSTRGVPRMSSSFLVVTVGDGIQLVEPVPGTVLRDITLAGNERVGLVVDLAGGDTSLVSLERVAASAEGDALGCVTQNGTALSGWDASVTRSGTATTNDAAFADVLEGLVQLTELPGPDDFHALVSASD